MSDLFKYENTEIAFSRPRSVIPIPNTITATCNSGELVPFYIKEVIPGDTVQIDVQKSLFRMLSPVVPTMDSLEVSVAYFYMPMRLCTQNARDIEKIFGVNVSGAFAPAQESTFYSTGNLFSAGGTAAKIEAGDLGQYLGWPIGYYPTSSCPANTMLIRMYNTIWNDYYRDENLQNPNAYAGWNSVGSVSTAANCWSQSACQPLLHTCKTHDYFTTSLPSPQRGSAVTLGLTNSSGSSSVNLSNASSLPLITSTGLYGVGNIKFGSSSYSNLTSGSNYIAGLYLTNSPSASSLPVFNFNAGSSTVATNNCDINRTNLRVNATGATVDLSDFTFDVNQVRLAFASQQLLELDSRGGSRFKELLITHYGTAPNDDTLSRPKYLGGTKFDINILQVLQTAVSDDSPIGQPGATSNTFNNTNNIISQSFKENGYIMGLFTIRPIQSYSQGVPSYLTINERTDIYWPVFAHIGEQPVMKSEIYWNTTTNNNVFGYQEAWIRYKTNPNRVAGFVAPAAGDSTLTNWSYTTNFSTAPTLNSSFITQDSSVVGDTLYDTETSTQFLFQIYTNTVYTTQIPVHCVPAGFGRI